MAGKAEVLHMTATVKTAYPYCRLGDVPEP